MYADSVTVALYCAPCSNRSINSPAVAHAGTDRQKPYRFIDPAPLLSQMITKTKRIDKFHNRLKVK